MGYKKSNMCVEISTSPFTAKRPSRAQADVTRQCPCISCPESLGGHISATCICRHLAGHKGSHCGTSSEELSRFPPLIEMISTLPLKLQHRCYTSSLAPVSQLCSFVGGKRKKCFVLFFFSLFFFSVFCPHI